jgi:hypothetical protein
MYQFDEINLNIDLKKPSLSHGHENYLAAVHTPTNKKIIYKKNKHGNPSLSRMEVSFGRLANLFLSPNLSSPPHLVVKNKNVKKQSNITGIAIEHLCYSIEEKEGLKKPFYSLNPETNWSIGNAKKVKDETQIPIYFLNQLPSGYFAQLMENEKNKKLSIDYKSLASILTTSYTLEEDDLHKGNFGFYVVKKNGKPHVVFFKIDHDLMFMDSIMSFQGFRMRHLFDNINAFNIIGEDLALFPNIKFSANYHWPTRFRYFWKFGANREYNSFQDNLAFANLANKPEFIKAKWSSFYKHILTPPELIHNTLDDSPNPNDSEKAHAALLTQATVSRLAALRAVLFSIKEFREFVINLSDREKRAILREIVPKNHPLEKHINKSFEDFYYLCTAPEGFEEKDTPMHTAIKLGEYRYRDTMRMFGTFINTKNDSGKTPLDSAVERKSVLNPNGDIRKDNQLMMQHLLNHGAQTKRSNLTILEKEQIAQYRYPIPYLKKINAKQSYLEFKEVLRDIGEDHHFCLKHKKNLAVECINHWIQIRKNNPDFRQELKQLYKDVNGISRETTHAPIKYLCQLRSRLWVIRQIRGLYGSTFTQSEINKQIKKGMDDLKTKPKKSFFTPSTGSVSGVSNASNVSSNASSNASSNVSKKSDYKPV